MGNLAPASIRSKLLLLGSLAFLPVVLLTVFNAWHQRKVEVEKATDRMTKVLQFAVINEEEVVQGTQQLMAALAEVPQVREGGSRCSGFLARILKHSPGYLNLGTHSLDGQVVCSALPLKRPVNAIDLPHFQGALRNRSLAIGQFTLGRITGRPVILFGYPVTDRKGAVSSVLFASIDLSQVTKFEAEIDVQTPGDAPYVKLDRNGKVLSSYPASQLFGRGNPVEKALFDQISSTKHGTFRATGADGVDRLYIYSAFQGQISREGGYALLGIPTRALFAESDRLLVANLTVLLAIVGIFLTIIWWGGNALIVRPLSILTDASKRMAAGDLTARSGLEAVRGEIGQLGKAFDDMAREIQWGQDDSRRMQEELHDAVTRANSEKAKSDAVLAGIGDGVTIVDREYRIRYQNQVHKDMVGDRIGEYCYSAYHGRETVCDSCILELSFQEGRIQTGERTGVANGKPAYFEMTASPLRDASGNIVAGIEVVRDVTERKRTERQISKSLKMLSALHKVDVNILGGADVEETLGGICEAIVDMGYRLCWIGMAESDHTVRVAAARGIPREEIDEMNLRWDGTPEGYGALTTVFGNGQSYLSRDIFEDDRFAPWKDKIEEWGARSLVYLPLKSDGGKVIGTLNVYSGRVDGFTTEDVGDLETFAQQCAVAMQSAKWLEELRDAHQRLAFHVNRMPLAYIAWGMDFRIQEWNPAAERIFGWKAEEVVGRKPADFMVPEEEMPHVGGIWSKLIAGEETYSLNANLRKDGKRITCEWFNNPLYDTTGRITGAVSMVHDVTEKTQLERQLQTAQRMEAVGTLAGGVAHDFNNSLTGIFGFSEMLRPLLKGNERALSHLNEVQRSAERAATLTRQLLTYSRRQPITPVNLSLNGVVTDLLKLVSKVVGDDIELRMHLGENLPPVFADPGQVEQVLMNLVINARDAMPDGGRLVIETEEVQVDPGFLRYHPYMSPGTYVVLSVTDTGVGIDAKTQERVFEPFFTTKGPSKGTGLGLAMVYGIVKQHNGFIHLYSEPGQGTTFKIYLPPAQTAPTEAPAPAPAELRGGSETVLLAEDDDSVRTLVENALKDLGYQVLSARNGQEAVAVFERNRDRTALALLDVAMPVMGGKEAFEVMHRIAPGLKVIFMSGYSADAVHESFILITGVPFLAKPFGPPTLARKVREVLDG
jgi:PAS domain S-box-containing protein